MNDAAAGLASIAACAFFAGVISGIILYGFEEFVGRGKINEGIVKLWLRGVETADSPGATSPSATAPVKPEILLDFLPPAVMNLRYRELLGVLSGLVNTSGGPHDWGGTQLLRLLARYGHELAGRGSKWGPERWNDPRVAETLFAERALDNLQATFSQRWRLYRAYFGGLLAVALLAAVAISSSKSPGHGFLEETPLYITSSIIVAAVSIVIAPLVRDILDRIAG